MKSVFIGKHIRRNGAVLDLACGKGDMLKFKAGGCALYVGIDIAIARRDALTDTTIHHRGGMPFAATLMVGDFCKDSSTPRCRRASTLTCLVPVRAALLVRLGGARAPSCAT